MRWLLLFILVFIGCKESDNINNTNKSLKVNTTWYWQLNGELKNYNVDLYDIDLFDTSKEKIKELKNEGKIVICYFSAGSYEDWREDAKNFKESELGKPLNGWEGERWLDIRSKNVRDIMKKRLDLAKSKGCDGIEPDNVDGYINDTGFNLTYNVQINYNKFLANEAKKRGLLIGLKNDLDQIVDLVDYFDFALNEECYKYNECDKLMPFIRQNKPVFNAEYEVDDFDKFCEYANSKKLMSAVYSINLDGSLFRPCFKINK